MGVVSLYVVDQLKKYNKHATKHSVNSTLLQSDEYNNSVRYSTLSDYRKNEDIPPPGPTTIVLSCIDSSCFSN